MKKKCLVVFALCSIATAQQAPSQYLLTFQLASGLDVTKLTEQQKGVFMEHAKYLGALRSKGLLLGGRTNETVNTQAILVFEGDESAARPAASEDPATKAGLVTSSVKPFNLLIPQSPPAVLVSDTKLNYDIVSKYIIGAAKKMPEEHYAFRPTDNVRSFGQLVGHIAEAQYIACSLVRGEEYKPHNIEQTLSKKADLIAALETGIGFCQESWSRLKPEALADKVQLFGRDRTKLGAMDIATAHAFEHYGNMATYLRMKGIVPPSSE
jgi:uncharacterized damage-inducible protein DinB/uncharacterized protein YciI